jgi:hypothetical protein
VVAFFGGPPIIPDVVIVDCEGSGEVEFSTIRSRKCSRDLFYILVSYAAPRSLAPVLRAPEDLFPITRRAHEEERECSVRHQDVG